MPAPVLQLRVPEDTLTRIDELRGDDTRSAWLQRLIDRELNGPQPAPVSVTDSPVVLPADEPCPGTVCAGPGCWQRDTARYGLRRLVLCTACAAVYDPRGMGKIFFAMLAGFAEMEREMMIERTNDGLAQAAAEGRHGGRRPVISKDMMRIALGRRADGESVTSIAKPRSTDALSGLSVFKQVSALVGAVGDCTW